MEKAKEIISKLKREGFRSTKIREAILFLFCLSKKPLSCQDIQKHLDKKSINANKTTVYRELGFLKTKNIIEEFQLDDGVKRYEISSNHHHHAICVKCRKIDCIELKQELKSQEAQIQKNNKFKIISHSLEFYGLCRKCQALKK